MRSLNYAWRNCRKEQGRINEVFTIRISVKIRNAIRDKIDSLLFFIIDAYTHR
jgi:hypothetical protein